MREEDNQLMVSLKIVSLKGNGLRHSYTYYLLKLNSSPTNTTHQSWGAERGKDCIKATSKEQSRDKNERTSIWLALESVFMERNHLDKRIVEPILPRLRTSILLYLLIAEMPMPLSIGMWRKSSYWFKWTSFIVLLKWKDDLASI